MEALGGQRHAGSGNGSRKGDGRVNRGRWYENELIEFKQTGKKQITIKAEDLDKIEREAAVTGRIPALVFELGGKEYVVHTRGDWMEYRGDGDG